MKNLSRTPGVGTFARTGGYVETWTHRPAGEGSNQAGVSCEGPG